MADRNTQGNNTMFFVIGGLIVLAIILGFFLWTPDSNTPADIEPAAGDVRMQNDTMTAPGADDTTGTLENEDTTGDTGTATDQ